MNIGGIYNLYNILIINALKFVLYNKAKNFNLKTPTYFLQFSN